MPDLTHCPLCGDRKHLKFHQPPWAVAANCRAVVCRCGVIGPSRETEELAAEAWNRRFIKDFDDAANRAATELPEGWEIRISISLHGGGVDVVDPDGAKTDEHLEGPNAFAGAVVSCLEYAIEEDAARKAKT
jgi:hypothetical protein